MITGKKRNLTKKTEIIWSYCASFFLPIFIWLAICILHGIYPFGNRTIMTGDITYQFIDYLAYFKSIFTENNDFIYTFSKTIGGDMAGFASYYLFSPFNFILLLFPNRMLPFGLLIMIMVKTALMSLSFQFMLTKMYGYRRENTVFSVTYSLMGYVIIYYQLYAYFDDFMLLPLITLGIVRLIQNPKKRVLYIVTLTLSIMMNYYIGWMLCIFAALFFLYTFFVEGKDIRKAEGCRILGSFTLSSLISGMMSSCVVIPALLSLRDEKNSFHIGFYTNFPIQNLFSRFYANSFKGDISGCMPNIYCGILILFLVWLYFFNKKIAKREKIMSGLFLLFLIVNMYINTLNVVWHGLNKPIGFPYRYSFLLSFLMLLMAYKGWINLEKESVKKPLILFAVLFVVYSVFLLFYGRDVLNRRDLLINAGIFAVLFVLFYVFSAAKKAGIVIGLLCFIQLCDLSQNFHNNMYYFSLEEMPAFQKYIDEVSELVDMVKEKDPDFYRMEKYFRRSHNDAMQFGYNGLTHYSSCEKKEVISYMGSLGFRNNGNWSFYDSGSTGFVDSLFGIRYIMSQYDTTGMPYEMWNKIVNEKEEYYIYKNPYALPLMFASDAGVLEGIEAGTNPFEFQNQIADRISGSENHIFTEATEVKEILHNLEKTEEGESTIYKKADPEKEAFLEYEITFDHAGHIETYLASKSTQEVTLFRNGTEIGDYMTKYSWNVIDVADSEEGRKETVSFRLNQDSLELTGAYFYYEDHSAAARWYENVTASKCSLEKITSSHLKGKASIAEDSCLVFSFPYEDSWKIRVDGQEVKTEKACGIFLSTNISAGEHNLELEYIPAGRNTILLSVFAFLCFLVYCFSDKYKILYRKK